MQVTNRKEIAIKTLLILISILSIILIKEGVGNIGHAIDIIENMGGFDIYPINHPDIIVHQFTTFKSGILVAESAFLGH